MAHESQFLRVEGAGDFERAKALGTMGILIGQQNSEHFRTVADVDRFHVLGQRVSQLTYRSNRIGGGSSEPDRGLSEYGAAIVERMNKVGVAVDISHCGDRTSLDAIEASRRPVLVTHSNCRTLVPRSARCKTDETIKRMAAGGGVMGVTMVRIFVRAGGPATIEDVLDHIDRVAKLAAVEHVGVGSDVDLDGRDRSVHSTRKFDLDGIDYAKKIFDLTEGLVRRNYSSRSIDLILGGNFKRALSARLGTPGPVRPCAICKTLQFPGTAPFGICGRGERQGAGVRSLCCAARLLNRFGDFRLKPLPQKP